MKKYAKCILYEQPLKGVNENVKCLDFEQFYLILMLILS